MKRLFRHQSMPSDGYSYMLSMRPNIKPRLTDRILGWFLNIEAESAAQYEDYEEYEHEPERVVFRNRAEVYDHAGPHGYSQEYACNNQRIMDREEADFRPRPVPSLSTGRLRRVQQALNDWKAATAYFESVSEPELVDYAVYEMEAAQKRYIYLLRSAKEAQNTLMRGR